jgi:hypothetical protein
MMNDDCFLLLSPRYLLQQATSNKQATNKQQVTTKLPHFLTTDQKNTTFLAWGVLKKIG